MPMLPRFLHDTVLRATAVLALSGGFLSSTALSSARADVLVGVALPRTGGAASYGDQVLNGVKAAAEAINAAGGADGEKIVLDVEDDMCDPKNAVSVANRIVEKSAHFVVGHVCSGASIAASDVYAENRVVMISPSTLAGKLTDRGLPGIFRVCGRDDQQGAFAADYIADYFKDKRFAIIHDSQTFSRGLADTVRNDLHKKGITEVLFEGITPGERDYSAVITRLRAAGVEFVYYGGYQQEMGQLLKQAVTGGFKAQWMGSSGIATREFASIAGSASDGVLMTFSRDPRKLPGSANLVASLRSRGIEPDGFTLYGYAALQVLAEAMDQAKSLDPLVVGKAMKSGAFATALGELKFDAKGDVMTPSYVMYEWRGGNFDYK
jgi:branched-chain amino acid transport system substrate-binding protein